MITRLLAGLLVTCAVSINVAVAEEERSAKPADGAPVVTLAENSEGKRIEWDDVDATPDDKAPKAKSAESPRATSDDAPSSPKQRDTVASEKPAEKTVTPKAPAASAKAAEGSSDAQPKETAADASPVMRAPGETAGAGSTTVTTSETATVKPVRAPSNGRSARVSTSVAASRESARERMSVSETRVKASRATTADRLARPRERAVPYRRPAAIRTAQAVQRPAAIETGPGATEVAVRQATPIAGGILCGGPAKWRCNWIEREHDKFYKFTKGHNWTDQTMATDYCATEKQMRVGSTTRIKSLSGGCCGYTIVQVTCRR